MDSGDRTMTGLILLGLGLAIQTVVLLVMVWNSGI